MLNKTQSIGYNERFVIGSPTYTSTSIASSPIFEELGEVAWEKTKPPAPEGLPDVEKVGATATEYGTEIPPPPEG